ncbi:hypothetical protein FPV67DRAFT_1153321 [Lyophyllum atratum]|nr:hypothetical protein FPV67DRAFT_1153321 [Lyophyllum atratum]
MVSFTLATVLLAAMTSISVLAAPTQPLDAATLLKNGQNAQKLNVAFQTMKETDPCTDEDKACMSEGVAVCRNGKWDAAQGGCSKTQACFALPSVRETGTLVTCTSEKNALSAIQATGATGGIFGNSTAAPANEEEKASEDGGAQDSTPVPSGNSAADACDDGTTDEEESDDNDDECSETDAGGEDSTAIPTSSTSTRSSPPSSVPTVFTATMSTSSVSSIPTADPGTVTVTITLGDQPTTLAPVTRTLSPEEASSVLSSLMANGATVIESPPSSTAVITSASAAPTITTIPVSSPAPASSGPAPTIILTAAPNATNAAPAATQTSDSSSSSGDYDNGY